MELRTGILVDGSLQNLQSTTAVACHVVAEETADDPCARRERRDRTAATVRGAEQIVIDKLLLSTRQCHTVLILEIDRLVVNRRVLAEVEEVNIAEKRCTGTRQNDDVTPFAREAVDTSCRERDARGRHVDGAANLAAEPGVQANRGIVETTLQPRSLVHHGLGRCQTLQVGVCSQVDRENGRFLGTVNCGLLGNGRGDHSRRTEVIGVVITRVRWEQGVRCIRIVRR